MSDLQAKILALLRSAGPRTSMTLLAIAAELEVDDHRVAGACHGLDQDRLLKRTSARPAAYAIRATALREVI